MGQDETTSPDFVMTNKRHLPAASSAPSFALAVALVVASLASCGDDEAIQGTVDGGTAGGGGQVDAGGTSGAGGSAASGGVITGGSGGGAGVAPLGKCGEYCEHVVAAGCPDDSELSVCVPLCNASHRGSGGCLPKYESFQDCVIGASLSCVNGDADLFSVCNKPVLELSACLVCEVEDDDEVCDKCEKSNCCTENRALYEVPEYPDYVTCLNGCQDPQCLSACEDNRPSVSAALKAITDCETKYCPAC